MSRYVSRPDLVPPKITVLRRAAGTAPGLLFLGPSSGPGQRGAMIVDDTGEPVWFHPTVPLTVMNLRAALYHGEPVLTWWRARRNTGSGWATTSSSTATTVSSPASRRATAAAPTCTSWS